MKILKKISVYVFVTVILLTPAVLVYGQSGTPINPTPGTPTPGTPAPQEVNVKFNNPLANQSGSLMQLITDILNKIVMPIAAIGVVLWIVWAGFQYLLAQGKPEAIKKANLNLMWSLIGAGLLLGAAGISAVLETTVNQIILKP